MNSFEYVQCTRCLMDNMSDDTITFDVNGHCDYCSTALQRKPMTYFPNEHGEARLQQMIAYLKTQSIHLQYDCIMGISGGLDSAYLLYLGAVKWGLRILAVHVDDGFDTLVAVDNIKKLSDACNIKLINIKPNRGQYNDLTRSFMLAGVPNIAMPQDNVLFACVYACAKKHNIKHFLSGGNFPLECILQRNHTHSAYDVVNIRNIHDKYGRGPIDDLTLISEAQLFIANKTRHVYTWYPLNYVEYNRQRAIDELSDFCGFQYYGSKHLENTLTKFIQQYWFFHKFNVDKRKAHLSSMIISDQLSREDAKLEMQKPLYDARQMEKDISFVLGRLNMQRHELEDIMAQPNRSHTDFKVSRFSRRIKVLSSVYRSITRRAR